MSSIWFKLSVDILSTNLGYCFCVGNTTIEIIVECILIVDGNSIGT